MKSTAALLEEARISLSGKCKKPTYYRLARSIGISDQLMYKYRKCGIPWSDESALKTAAYLPYPPELVLLWARMEREKNPEILAILEKTEKRLLSQFPEVEKAASEVAFAAA